METRKESRRKKEAEITGKNDTGEREKGRMICAGEDDAHIKAEGWETDG